MLIPWSPDRIQSTEAAGAAHKQQARRRHAPPSRAGARLARSPLGMLHPWVGQKLLKCNDIKSVFTS